MTKNLLQPMLPKGHQGPICPLGGHWLLQIFIHLAIPQTRIKVSS